MADEIGSLEFELHTVFAQSRVPSELAVYAPFSVHINHETVGCALT